MKNCIKCAVEIPIDNALFCPFCGASQTVREKSGRRPKSRGNGQGTAFRRRKSDGTLSAKWTAQYVYDWKFPDDPSKPRIPLKRTKGGFDTKRDALDFISTLKITKPKAPPKLSYYWDLYKNGRYATLSDSKQTSYRIAWEKRLTSIHNTPVDALSVGVLQKTLDKSCDTYYTMKDCKNLLSNLYKLIAADGYASKDVPSLIQLPQLEEKEQTPFTQDEQKALWKAYEKGEKSVALPLLMIYSGMQPGEVQHLKVDMIDLDRRIIVGAGLKTKVRKASPVVIAEILLPVVQDLIDNARPDGYLWIQSKDDWYDEYYHALDVAGVEKRPPYACRHTTATALAVTENIAPQTVKKVMRWSTAKMLDRYAHPDTQDALNAVDKLKKE